jgi:hypothetical protein
MATLPIPKEDAQRYADDYSKLPNQKCKHCGADMKCKEISLQDYILLRALKDRYY